MKKWVVLAVGLSATAAMAQGTAVRVVKDYSQLPKCKSLGEVKGENLFAMWSWGTAHDDVLNKMKQKVVESGGNYLLLINLADSGGQVHGLGEAYRCP